MLKENMKTKLLTLVTILGLGASLQAVQIDGSITFNGGVTLNTGSAATASAVNSWVNPAVQSVAGDFATYVAVNDAVSFTAPWSFNSGAVIPLWEVNGFQFNLTSSSISYQGGGSVVVDGTGVILRDGFDPTPGTWSFTTQNPSAQGVFSFSASAGALPDGGMTAMLLGGALSGLAFLRRKLV